MLLSSCDIGDHIFESQKRFADLDFSFLNNYEYPNLWNVYELLDENVKKNTLEQIKS